MNKKFKLKLGDKVKVISGKERGKVSNIKKILSGKDKVILEGLNIVKKSIKPRTPQEKGKIVELESPIHISNVMLFHKDSVSRVGFKIENEKKIRYAKKSGEKI